jgi:hypothetical protein
MWAQKQILQSRRDACAWHKGTFTTFITANLRALRMIIPSIMKRMISGELFVGEFRLFFWRDLLSMPVVTMSTKKPV